MRISSQPVFVPSSIPMNAAAAIRPPKTAAVKEIQQAEEPVEARSGEPKQVQKGRCPMRQIPVLFKSLFGQ